MNTTPLPCENGISIWTEVVLSKRLKDNTIRGLGNMEKNKRNPVAKNMNKFNKPATQTDRKKAAKKGYVKHNREIDVEQHNS